ncbi:CWF19-like protein 2 [Argonauta hians]
MEPIAFKSCYAIEEERNQLKKARKDVIKKVKSEYEKAERKKEVSKSKGYDDWMLPSVLETIDKQSERKVKSKKSKKEKKKKKHKKEKKRHQDSESSDTESSSNESQWVEKRTEAPPITNTPAVTTQLKRDNWMEMGFEALPTVSRQQIKQEKNQQKNAQREEERKKLEMVQQERELNPFWKDGGTGLPEEHKKEEAVPHISWLRKSYKRCQELAKENGQTLEDVVAERWGSLRKLESLMKKAEKIEREKYGSKPFRYPESEKSHGSRKEMFGDRKNMFRSPESPQRHSSDTQTHFYGNRQHSSHNNDGDSSYQSHRSRSPGYHRREGEESQKGSSVPHSSRYSYNTERGKTLEKYSDRNFPYSSSTSRSGVGSSSSSSSSSSSNSGKYSQFLKPSEHDDLEMDRRRQSAPSGSSSVPRWKKQGSASQSHPIAVKNEDIKRVEDRVQPGSKPGRHRKYSSDSSSSSSSSSRSSSLSPSRGKEESDDEYDKEEDIPIILTEEQMNGLSAKILRAELMGDEDLMKELQAKLKAAKQARAQAQEQQVQKRKSTKTEPEDVILSHVDRSGIAWPVMDSGVSESGKKKKKLIKTHNEDGHRQKYFHDDDKFDLKNLVQREKMSTAESQNSMFARLAGRCTEKSTEDYSVDDMFVSGAAREQSEAKTFDLQKARAIYDHQKMAKSMSNCKLCFEKISKHLLVAIGRKVYLALPDCPSLSDGHCILAPIQHVTSSTAMDEDVWEELQTFKKVLVRMFEGLNKDAVFLETSMHLQHFPHAQIECVPIDIEDGAMAPMYFKKAILECESEWNMNRKLVDLSKKNIRRSIPKGFPFFCVNFGLQSGFAHVIEDEKKFSMNFGKEIIGGMIDADPSQFRKGRSEKFEVQRQKVLQFSNWWKAFDFTSN